MARNSLFRADVPSSNYCTHSLTHSSIFAMYLHVLVLGAHGSKYEYKYSGFVLEYNSSTSTRTKYYIQCRNK